MAAQPGRIFTAAELADLLERSSLTLGRRADRLVFDAMRKAAYRGWVVRVDRGRYRSGAVAPTTLRRIVRWGHALNIGFDGPERSAYASWHRMTRHGRPIPLPGPAD